MEYLYEQLAVYMTFQKKEKIIFPHRLAPEKQPEIFEDLAKSMPDVEFFMCHKEYLVKTQYHRHLAESKIVFSANLQETLGISVYEGALMGTYPLMPDRLSYSEIWPEQYLYDSNWTKDWDSYIKNKDLLINLIKKILSMYNEDDTIKMIYETRKTAEEVGEKFFNGAALYKAIIDSQI